MAVYGRELRPRLWHWQARHPEWEDEPDAGWDPLVESYAYVSAANELVLVDPLIPDDDAQAFWPLSTTRSPDTHTRRSS